MLILIGTVPTAYALNRALPDSQIAQFSANSAAASKIVEEKAAGYSVLGNPRPAVMEYVAHHKISEGTYPSLAVLIQDIDKQVKQYGSIAKIPAEAVGNTRNDMYLADEATAQSDEGQGQRSVEGRSGDAECLQAVARRLDEVHPDLGQDLGRDRARPRHDGRLEADRHHRRREDRQDAFDLWPGRSAELVAAATIAAADMYGLPVSTTHVLSSGVAGTMAANGSGLQLSTIRNIALAWVLTLPAAMMLSGFLYWVFRSDFLTDAGVDGWQGETCHARPHDVLDFTIRQHRTRGHRCSNWRDSYDESARRNGPRCLDGQAG